MFRKDSPEKYNKMGRDHITKGEILNARNAYLKALSMDPENLTSLNNLSQICWLLNERDKAMGYSEVLLETCKKNEKSEQTLMLESNALVSLKRFEEANETLDEILKINPNNIIALFQKSHYLETHNRLDEALECINRILKAKSHDISANLSKARILIKLKDYDQAEEVLRLIFKLDSKNRAAMNLKSKLTKEKNNSTISAHDFMIRAVDFWDMDDFEKSLAYFDKAIDIDRNHDEIWYLRGELLIRMGQITNAIHSFKTAFELNPESGGIIKKKEFFRFLNLLKRVNSIFGFEK